MKISLLALSVAAPLLALPVLADDAPSSLPEGIKFYGKVNASLQEDIDYDTKDSAAASEKDSNWAWHTYASRLGGKGQWKLDDDWALLYKAEYEINADNGYGSQNDFIAAREVYAGIHSKTFGTVEGGKIDTPLRMLQGKLDLFADLTAADVKNVMVGKNRDSHTYLYRTPTWAGWNAAFATVNFREVDNSAKFVDRSGNSMSVTYEKGKWLTGNDNFYFAVAHDEGIRDHDIERVAAQYKFGSHDAHGVFTVGALAQNARKTAPDKNFATGDRGENGFMLNGAWGFSTADTVKVQWAKSQEVEYAGDLWAVGYDHKINQDLKVYAYHAELGGSEAKSGSFPKQRDRTLESTGVGVEYSF